jgi:hypothetical protein
MPVELLRAVRYRFSVAGFPACCEFHVRSYFLVVWDLGEAYDTGYMLGLN